MIIFGKEYFHAVSVLGLKVSRKGEIFTQIVSIGGVAIGVGSNKIL